MKRSDYRRSAPAQVRVEPDGARWALVFVRELAHPPDKVWRALTDPAQLREWAPFDADRDLSSAGSAQLAMAGAPEPELSAAEVRRAERPHVLEYTWGKDVLCWTLEPIASGTRLTLRHSLEDRSWLPKVAAGWHICLDVAERALSGEPVGRIVGAAARDHGWEALEKAYADRTGIPSSGFPE
ncbi:MAG TPA: SRPBCC family protein [Polyangiales bacterium]|nr:SRPBCC family protein [Polyangiales bacterium]